MAADDRHPLHDASDATRRDYLTVIASLVAADQDVSESELAPLDALCKDVGLADDARAAIVESAHAPDAAAVAAALERIKGDVALRTALLTDAVVIVFADGTVAPAESRELERLARALDVEPAQLAMIGRYVESVVLGKPGGGLHKDLGKGVAEADRAARPGVIQRIYKLFKR